MTSLSDWHILRELKPEFVSNIKTVQIYDENAVFLITKSDDVYGYGLNSFGCLGFGHDSEVKRPQLIKELCGKQVVSIALNGRYPNALALTTSGHMYSWGRNTYGQLCCGNTDKCFVPKLIESLEDINISEFRFGGWGYCLALSVNGKVYSWGHNAFGQTGIGNRNCPQLIPNQVIALNDHKVIAVDCGENHSLALTDNGLVFGFGDNDYGQFGIARKKVVTIPTKLNMKNIRISKIKCGLAHSLMLSTDGDIYACGSNQYGQIGDGTNRTRFTPVKLSLHRKCLDIAATREIDLSIAKLDDRYCYVWGKCSDNRTFSSPCKTTFDNFNSVIINFSEYTLSYDPIICEKTSVINTRFINSFNNKKYCDIAFKIGNQLIYVQKSYLITVCKHFEDMFSENNWSESSNNEIPINQYSYSVYYAFLKYLYTGCVDVKPENLYELTDLAKSYFEEELFSECVEMIKNSLKYDNVCTICSFAIKYDLIELKHYCLKFVVENFNKVKETHDYKQTDNSSLLKDINEYFSNKLNEK